MTEHVHVLTTGGTIASTPGNGGAAPELTGSDLLQQVPDLEAHADPTVEQIAQLPGFDVDLETMAEVAERATAAAETGADAVVVTHGTDTMAETAYFLDVTTALDAPIVLTGSQRRPDELSSDAPANLLAAFRTATHDRVREGVFVAFDQELHAARDVRKVHSSKLRAFASPNDGPVATLSRDDVEFHRTPKSETTPIPGGDTDARVEIVTSAAGADGAQVARAVEAGVDGLVLAGTGLGNATAELSDAIAAAIEAGVPVVVTSRCHAGGVGAVYGTRGGGRTLRDHGVIHAGDLTAPKARLKLMLALSHAGDTGAIRALFE